MVTRLGVVLARRAKSAPDAPTYRYLFAFRDESGRVHVLTVDA